MAKKMEKDLYPEVAPPTPETSSSKLALFLKQNAEFLEANPEIRNMIINSQLTTEIH